MDFDTFEQRFVPFCITPGFGGGKARSYYLAIRYLAEYMGLQDLSNGNVRKILTKDGEIRNPACNFYRQLEQWLEHRHQKSYLTKGYIKAAMSYFQQFAANHHLI